MKLVKKKKYIITIILIMVMMFIPKKGFCQSDIEGMTNSLLTTAHKVIGAIVFIQLIFTVWALVTNRPDSKNYIIGTVVGIIVWGIAYMLVQSS